MAEAVAARCGDTNERIDFVLKTFGMKAPKFVSDVSPKVRDVMARDVVSVAPKTTVAEESLFIQLQEGLNSLAQQVTGWEPIIFRAASKVWMAMSRMRGDGISSRNPPKWGPR